MRMFKLYEYGKKDLPTMTESSFNTAQGHHAEKQRHHHLP